MSYTVKPLTKIIGLSSVLAVGFLLVVLAGAIYGNWFPIIAALVFAVAYLPVVISNGFSSSGFYDDLMNESSGQVQDLGRFLASFLTVSGFGLPVVLCHSHVLTYTATVLTEIGGSLIFATVVLFTSFFDPQEEESLDI